MGPGLALKPCHELVGGSGSNVFCADWEVSNLVYIRWAFPSVARVCVLGFLSQSLGFLSNFPNPSHLGVV